MVKVLKEFCTIRESFVPSALQGTSPYHIPPKGKAGFNHRLKSVFFLGGICDGSQEGPSSELSLFLVLGVAALMGSHSKHCRVLLTRLKKPNLACAPLLRSQPIVFCTACIIELQD